MMGQDVGVGMCRSPQDKQGLMPASTSNQVTGRHLFSAYATPGRGMGTRPATRPSEDTIVSQRMMTSDTRLQLLHDNP